MKQIEARLAKLEAKLAPASQVRFDLARHSNGHPKQYAFTKSKARQRTASCSRRAGKSEGCAGLLLDIALARSGCVALYLTKTRINAKRIIWGILKRINRDHALGGNPKEAELCMEFPNGSSIYLGGVNNKDEIEKFRGLPIAVCVLDESQAIAGYLQQLVDEVLAAALMDYDGSLVLVGTPAPVPAGYFWECIQNPEWEHFEWTVFDNPWIQKKSGKSPAEHLQAELKRRGVKEDDPVIQREWFGKWVYDPNSLVFRYSPTNNYEQLPVARGDWSTIVGVDLGFDDSDAICVLKWNSTLPGIWLVHEDVCAKQTVTRLGERLVALAATYEPIGIVVDTGGLGKKIAEELTQRWSLKVEAAEKERKLEHIELLNDAMRTGTFYAKSTSRFAQDSMLVEWDRSNPEKPKISDRYHSDICDAVLYAYRKAKQWLFVPEPEVKPRYGSPEWMERQQQQMAAQATRMQDDALDEALRRKAERDEMEAYE